MKEKLNSVTEEFSAFCSALLVTLKWANKSNSEENQKMLALTTEKVRLLEAYMSNNEEKCSII